MTVRDDIAHAFDAAFYLAGNPDVRAAGEDPLNHFLTVGWRQGRKPHSSFDVAYYLAANPDVAAADINPFHHYVTQGRREGRRSQRELEALRRQLDQASSPQSRVADWRGAADLSEPIGAAMLWDAVTGAVQATGTGTGGLVVSMSHDDYAVHFGGVQVMIADEQAAFAMAGISYLHLSPAAPLPMLAKSQPISAFRVRVRLDGRSLGVAVMADVIEAVEAVRQARRPVEIVFHHLMGWAPEVLTALPVAARNRPLFWLHDLFTLCSSYALMRNEVAYCHAPPASSVACQVCTYGSGRAQHWARMAAFFRATEPFLLAPSASTLALWRNRVDHSHAGAAIVPLARLLLAPQDEPSLAPVAADDKPAQGRVLRVAHIGARLTHKGWLVFEALALRFAGNPNYAFYHLGVDEHCALPGCVKNIPVRVTPERREAMVEAIAERSIDVVVSWSLWPETFCFAVHEALAGGAFVVARKDAGNVWPAVRDHAPRRGIAIEDEAGLFALFSSGAILRRVAEAPAACGALLPGSGTAEWLLQGRTFLPPVVAGVEIRGANA